MIVITAGAHDSSVGFIKKGLCVIGEQTVKEPEGEKIM